MGNAPVFVETKKSKTEPDKHTFINLADCHTIVAYKKNMVTAYDKNRKIIADFENSKRNNEILKSLDIIT